MDYLVLDCETLTFCKGNPYSLRNKLCLVGFGWDEANCLTYDVEYSDHSYKDTIKQMQEIINEAKTLVLFNGKFDLAWLRRYGITFEQNKIWDCQLVHFILSGQQDTYPSLNQVAEYYNLGQKLDTIKEYYWDTGIDTPQIPLPVLTEYLIQDLTLTEQVYLKQKEQVELCPLPLQRLINLSNQDLLVLLEMETNGLKMNFPGMKQASITTNEQIKRIKGELSAEFNAIPADVINFNSNDHLSALLYGGTITQEVRQVIGQYKSGSKLGQDRYSVSSVEYLLPRRYEPPKKSELKKEGFFATNEETLRNIKTSKPERVLLDKILELSKLEKLNGTYYEGLEKLHKEKDWEPSFIHGQFNMCVARTGRLSSSSPNLQNFPEEVDNFIVSRY